MKMNELIDEQTQRALQAMHSNQKKRKRRRKRKTEAVQPVRAMAEPRVTVKQQRTYSTAEIESLMDMHRYIPNRRSVLK